MPFAIQVHETGDPDVLKYEEIEVPPPGAGEVLIKQTAVGLNYIDVYFRTGLYAANSPFIPGLEAAGIIEAVGEAVDHLNVGDRVGYASPPIGAYAEQRIMPANRVIKLPKGISDEQAAASMVKGMTAEYLLHRTYNVQEGDTILFHAAAGGVGLVACQWAKHMGATIIGTVGSAEKAELARANGCDHVINYNEENFVKAVQDITKGHGVPVVYDSVGQKTFMGSLDCLQTRGMMVSFGNASGSVEAIEPGILAGKGSLFLTRPSMMDYTRDDQEYQDSAKTLFDVMEGGHVKVSINQRYALEDAAQAHSDLEARKTTGSTILTVA